MDNTAPGNGTLDHAPFFRGVFLIAFATLLFEVGLIRVFSFTIWHHFGYVVISTALLGFGASGTLLAVWHSFGTQDVLTTMLRCSVMAALSTFAVLVLVSVSPLHPMSILSDPRQMMLFVTYQIATAVPFFFSGVVIALALRTVAARVDRLYFWDLVGAGLGCAFAVPIMNYVTPPGAVLISAAVFALGGAAFTQRAGPRTAAVGLALALTVAGFFPNLLEFTPARTKELALQLNTLGFKPHFSRWTALFRTDAVEDVAKRTADRHLPGSSRLKAVGEKPQFYINHDATAGTGIYDLSDSYEVDYLESSVLRFPYLVTNEPPEVLVIGVGGGRDMVAAKQFGASRVVGIELDPAAVELIGVTMDEYSNGFFTSPGVDLRVGEGRHFVRNTPEQFDLIQLTGVDTLSAEASGSHVLAENFLYSTEAFHDYFAILQPGGILSFAMGNLNPNQPRAAGRIVSIAQRSLRERGIDDPENYVIAVDSRNLYTEVMINTRPYTDAEVQAVATEAERLGFVLLLAPGLEGHPVFEALVRKTGADREEYLDQLKYKVAAITDDRPFFFSFFRWGDLFQPGTLTPSHVSALGQIVLGLLVVSLTALGGVFVLAPLFVIRRKGIVGKGAEPWGILVYFTAIGLGFMFFEISLIQRFVLFLGYPTYSLTVTLFSLLTFLGCGSYLSRRWLGREHIVLPVAVLLIAALTIFYMYGLPVIQDALAGSHIVVRAAVTALLMMPLGLVLGLFFPLGIRSANAVHEDLVPWAWGINGCASVSAGVLTVILAMTYGFSRVWMLSTVVYAVGVAALLLTRNQSRGEKAAA